MEDEENLLLQDNEGSLLEGTDVVASKATKDFSFLGALAKLPRSSEVQDYFKALKEGTVQNTAEIQATGSKDSLVESVRADRVSDAVNIASNANAPVEGKSVWLADEIKQAMAERFPVEGEAARTLTYLPELGKEVVMPQSALELREETLRRHIVLRQLTEEEAETRGVSTLQERGWWNLAFIPRELFGAMVPVSNTETLTGIVPGQESESLVDRVFPGKQFNREAQALFDPDIISKELFDELAPQVVSRVFDKGREKLTFGLLGEEWGEPEIQNMLLTEGTLYGLTDPASALEIDIFVAMDYAGIIGPVVKGGFKAFSTVDTLELVRARELAAEVAVEVMENGRQLDDIAQAAEEALTTVDDVEAIALPRIMNPQSAIQQGVAQLDTIGEIMENVNAIKAATGLDNLDDLKRVNPPELEKATAATVAQAEKRLGRKIRPADIQPYNATPGTGIYTPALRILVGKAKGGGYDEAAEAVKRAKAMGLSDIKVEYIPRVHEDLTQPTLKQAPDVFNDPLPVEYTTADGKKYTHTGIKATEDDFLEDIEGTIYVNKKDADRLAKDPNTPLGEITFEDAPRQGTYPVSVTSDGNVVIRPKITKVGPDDGGIATVGRDEYSGGWYIVYNTGVKEKGFFDPIEVLKGLGKDKSFARDVYLGLAKILSTGRLLETQELFGRAVMAEGRRNALVKLFNKEFVPAFRALNKEELSFLNTIARYEDINRVWLDPDVLKQRFFDEFGFGSDTTKFLRAHTAFRQINDLDWYLRNANIYSDMSARGLRQVGINGSGAGNIAPQPGTVHATLSGPDGVRPSGHVYNAETSQVENWSFLNKAQAEKEGYVLIKFSRAQEIGPDKARVKNVLVKKAHLEDTELHPTQLEYRPGGHRIYDKSVRYWGKIAQYGRAGSDEFLIDPLTLIGGRTKVEMKEFVDSFNDYVEMAEKSLAATKKSGKPPSVTSEMLQQRSRHPALPTGGEMLDLVSSGRISSKSKLEIVDDRALPSQYSKSPEGMQFAEESYGSQFDIMHDTGRLYYSRRGDEIMKDAANNDLPVLDITEAVDQSMQNITRTVSYNSYVVAKMERWVAQYKSLLKLDKDMTLSQMFNAPFREGLDSSKRALRNAADAQRSVTRRILNWTSPEGRVLDNTWNQIMHWVEASGGTDIAKTQQRLSTADKFGEILGFNKTASFLKGWAFHTKMGFGYWGQLPLQLLSSIDLIAVDTSKALRAVETYLAFGRAYDPKSDHKALRLLFEHEGAGKALTGFDDADEFIEMLDQMKFKSGFNIVNRTHAVIDDVTTGNLFGMSNNTASKIQRAKEAGAVFFYEAEKMNKAVAWQIAWRQLREELPDLHYTDQVFLERVNARASTLARGMDNASSAAWQKGLTSPMTQFMSFPVRTFELFLGKELTDVQKLRFAIGQVVLYGTSVSVGVGTATGWLQDWANRENGVPTFEDDPLYAIIQRGSLDAMLYYSTGGDALYGERGGVGRFFEDTLAEFFSMGRYGPTSPAEMAGGASASIFLDTFNGFGSVIDHFVDRAQSEDLELDEGWDLLASDISESARVISSWNAATKAMAAYQAGVLYTRRRPGKDVYLMADDLNKADAVLIGLGLNPAQSRVLSAVLSDNKARKASVTDHVASQKQIDFEMMVAMADTDPKRREAKLKNLRVRSQALLSLIRVELRGDVIAELDRYEYRTAMSQKTIEAWKQRQVMDKAIKDLDQQIKESVE